MMTMIITVTKYVNKKIMTMTYVAQQKKTKARSGNEYRTKEVIIDI